MKYGEPVTPFHAFHGYGDDLHVHVKTLNAHSKTKCLCGPGGYNDISTKLFLRLLLKKGK